MKGKKVGKLNTVCGEVREETTNPSIIDFIEEVPIVLQRLAKARCFLCCKLRQNNHSVRKMNH